MQTKLSAYTPEVKLRRDLERSKSQNNALKSKISKLDSKIRVLAKNKLDVASKSNYSNRSNNARAKSAISQSSGRVSCSKSRAVPLSNQIVKRKQQEQALQDYSRTEEKNSRPSTTQGAPGSFRPLHRALRNG